MKKCELTVLSMIILSLGTIMAGGAFAFTDSDVIDAQVTVPAVCLVTLNSTSINFGSVTPGTDTGATNEAVTVTNDGNTAATNTTIEGTNWLDATTLNFTVGSTEYLTSAFTYGDTGLALTASPVALTGGSLNPAASLTMYFGVGVPSAQAAATYNQNITVSMNC